jgi:L-ascorbate metabolism protein UlaG (beta-lactamase superfamily)
MSQKFFLVFLGMCLSASAQAATTKLAWWGHSAFEITTPEGHVLFIDPWLTNPLDPAAQNGKNPLDSISKADYILLTHGHFDHVGETVALAKKTGAKLVTNFELGTNLVRLMDFPKDQAGMDTLMNPGGSLVLAGGEVTVTMTSAVHSSGLDVGEGKAVVYGGNPAGFVIQIKNGPTIYHTGDTAYFSDMAEIGTVYHPDVALINLGGHFGMEPAEAAHAAQAVKAKLVIPHHYKTFPVLVQSPAAFFKALDAKHITHQEMTPGETIEFQGTRVLKSSPVKERATLRNAWLRIEARLDP